MIKLIFSKTGQLHVVCVCVYILHKGWSLLEATLNNSRETSHPKEPETLHEPESCQEQWLVDPQTLIVLISSHKFHSFHMTMSNGMIGVIIRGGISWRFRSPPGHSKKFGVHRRVLSNCSSLQIPDVNLHRNSPWLSHWCVPKLSWIPAKLPAVSILHDFSILFMLRVPHLPRSTASTASTASQTSQKLLRRVTTATCWTSWKDWIWTTSSLMSMRTPVTSHTQQRL